MIPQARGGQVSRRAAVATVGVTAAALLGGGRVATAHSGGVIHADSDSVAPAIEGNNTSNGPGVLGTGVDAAGVRCQSENGNGLEAVHNSSTVPAAAVYGENLGSGPGIVGRAVRNSAVRGDSDRGFGVTGVHTSGSFAQPAILAWNQGAGPGLRGLAPGPNAAVQAYSGSFETPSGGPLVPDCGLALEAVGHTVLRPPSTADTPTPPSCSDPTLEVVGPVSMAGQIKVQVGSGTVSAGTDAVTVNDPRAGAASHINVVLTGPPNKGVGKVPAVPAAVAWIERSSGSFKAHLTRATELATPFTYTIVDPA